MMQCQQRRPLSQQEGISALYLDSQGAVTYFIMLFMLLQHVQQLEARLALRLQEAAQRRVSHLDQIKERAAISKEEKEACPPMSPPKTHRGLSCCACCAAS